MSAVDEIPTAIDKLTKLKAESTPGHWRRFLTDPRYAVINSTALNVTPTIKATNADLIVTLHATIDAQLALLDGSLTMHSMYVKAGLGDLWSPTQSHLTLARAINGGTK